MNTTIPVIKNDNGIPTLYVKGEPFFALAGEVHNSSASSLAYMEKEVWPKIKGLHMNTVIVPLYWECVEPEEGRYDFTLLDGLIGQARDNDMHLAFLWFGLWKNSESTYVPAWMKKDTETYFHVRKVTGEPINTISPLCAAAVEKDRQAFTRLMERIREIDGDESTVIMMQIENEIGVLGTDRDYSGPAQEAFSRAVPEDLASLYHVEGTWKEAFGEDAEEFFMACCFAEAVETITSSGRAAYPLPCYTNAWLKQHPWYPGSYPCGGPVREVQKIWKAKAPSLFALSPDIYVPYVADVMDEYSYEGNPLMIPEIRKDPVAASYCLYAFGRHNALGYSPFGIEDLGLDPASIEKPPLELMAALNIDASAWDITGSREALGGAYALMEQLKPLYLRYRGTPALKAYVKRNASDFGAWLRFTDYNMTVSYARVQPAKPAASGMIFELSENRFLIAGMMSTFAFQPKPGENAKVGILRYEEGEFVDGEWKAGRILNGDEQGTVRLGDKPACVMIELYKY